MGKIRKKTFALSAGSEQELCDKYLDGYRGKELSNLYHINEKTVYAILNRHNIKERHTSCKYKFNENCFSSIDTPQKAYFLGLFHADGYNNTKNNRIEISLQEQDAYLLRTISNLFFGGRRLDIKRPKNTGWANMHRLFVSNKQVSKDLLKHGACREKTINLKFPSFLDSELIRHYLRGMFDGDGSFCVKTNGVGTIYGCFSVISTVDWADRCAEVLELQFGINCNIEKRQYNNGLQLHIIYITKKSDLYLLFYYLYNNSDIYLTRKYNKFRSFIASHVVDLAKRYG